MPKSGYEYNEDLNRCYKFHTNPSSWLDAYVTCSAELSYLAVIDDQIEANFFVNLTAKKAPDNAITGGSFTTGVVHLGFQNLIEDEGWSTIKGIPVSAGYSHWAVGEPNGGIQQKCGSMYYNGQLNDIECAKRCFFICEHDVVVPPTEADSAVNSDAKL